MRFFNFFKPAWVHADHNGVKIKASSDQLKTVLTVLIEHAQSSQALRSWLYFKCVPQEYKQLQVERDYFKKKYEEMIGYHPMQHTEPVVTSHNPTVQTEQNQSEVQKNEINNAGRTSSYKAKKPKKTSNL